MHKKRGQSFFAEVIDRSAKKFLNQCSLCGRVGLLPNALDVEQVAAQENKAVDRHIREAEFSRSTAVKHLRKRYEPLPLDRLGRCEVCARVAAGKHPGS
jgi:hypothetical protein